MRAAIAFAALTAVAAQDPAQGWLGYAVGTVPGTTRLTKFEGYWKVGATPRRSNSFYSPWFGSDTSDNLNLVQPVNPWENQWLIYNEYYQWSPTKNVNSAMHTVKAGDILYGRITYDGNNNMIIYHKDMTDGWDVTTTIPVQMGKNGQYKNYTILYVVYEKTAPCGDYPPDGQVTFYNISVEYDGKDRTNDVVWKTAFVDDVCNNRASVLNQTTIQITWNTMAADPPQALIDRDQKGSHGLQRPSVLAAKRAAEAASAAAKKTEA